MKLDQAFEIIENGAEDYLMVKDILRRRKSIKIGELEKITDGLISPIILNMIINFATLTGIINLFYINSREKKNPAKRYYCSPESSEHYLVEYIGKNKK